MALLEKASELLLFMPTHLKSRTGEKRHNAWIERSQYTSAIRQTARRACRLAVPLAVANLI